MSLHRRRSPDGTAPTREHPRAWWLVLAALVTAIALAGAGAVSTAWQNAVRKEQQNRLDAATTSVAAAVRTSLLRLNDFSASVAGLYQANPRMTTGPFSNWLAASEAKQRYPGILAFGGIAYVRRAALPSFLAAQHRDPAPTNPYPGLDAFASRPGYCLTQFSAVFSDSYPLESVSRLDQCAVPQLAGVYFGTRDSGQTLVVPFTDAASKQHVFLTVTPVFRTATVPATVSARRDQIIGWSAGMFFTEGILHSALQGLRGAGVTLTRSDGANASVDRLAEVRGGAGISPTTTAGVVDRTGLHHDRITIEADGEWTVDLYLPAPGGMSPRAQGLSVFLACLVVIAMALSLVIVLGRGRQRALHLVAVKTRELHEQATHDVLTGLPNRALLMDRVERRLAQSLRDGSIPAVLFLDLDGFKHVNDTLGHAAGDELLQAVAGRLQSVMRQDDSVARLGGDEFVVLLSTSGDAPHAEVVAQRVLDVLREPVPLARSDDPVRTTASIGIATGLRDTAEALLHDADVALYEAKRAGRDRFVTFTPDTPTPTPDLPTDAVPRPRLDQKENLHPTRT